MRTRWMVSLVVGFAMLATACSSGPSSPDLREATTTTTTEPPPEGVEIILIANGRFRPANLKIDLTTAPIVRWVHEDDPEREYVITGSRGFEMESPTLQAGDDFEFDFSEVEPAIYRYAAFVGNARIPGSVDTRPDQ
ncbi:MAG: hypothetical protein ACE5GC_06225 [Acidimicrobiia bacterium]